LSRKFFVVPKIFCVGLFLQLHFFSYKIAPIYHFKGAIMRGDLVIIRTYGNLPLIRRVWDEDQYAIYITNDEQFKILTNKKDGFYLGFQQKDVFKFNPELAKEMEILYKKGEWDWNKLEPLK
jgi:hypothetical protein